MGVVLLTITPGGQLAKCLLPVPTILCSAGLEALVSEGGMLPLGDTPMIQLSSKLRLLLGQLGLFMPLKGKEESYYAGCGN